MTGYNYFRRGGASYVKVENEEFFLGYGDLSTSPENFIVHNGLSRKFNYLVFFDSRGATVKQEGLHSTITLLRDYFETLKLSYLIVSRPLNLTIIPTLLSFCENTLIEFDNVITNVGFVDTTPKKKDTLLDIESQLDNANIDYTYKYLCDFELLNGNTEELGTLSITESAILDISKRLERITSKIYFINSPEVSTNTIFERKRPKCFFPQIIKSNELVSKVSLESRSFLVDISRVGINTYDGVHFTNKGHQICHNTIISSLIS